MTVTPRRFGALYTETAKLCLGRFYGAIADTAFAVVVPPEFAIRPPIEHIEDVLIILIAHLLGNEYPAGLKNARDLVREDPAVAIQN